MTHQQRFILYWFPMPLLGILNGMLRELLLTNYFEEAIARRISVFTLIIFLFIYGLGVQKKLNLGSLDESFRCSISWVALTILFEFLVGHFIFQVSFDNLIADYNILSGSLWPLVLFFTGLLPFILKRMHSVT